MRRDCSARGPCRQEEPCDAPGRSGSRAAQKMSCDAQGLFGSGAVPSGSTVRCTGTEWLEGRAENVVRCAGASWLTGQAEELRAMRRDLKSENNENLKQSMVMAVS